MPIIATHVIDKAGIPVISLSIREEPLEPELLSAIVTTLRTLSSGRATSTMEFDSFKQAPDYITEEVIKKVRGIIS